MAVVVGFIGELWRSRWCTIAKGFPLSDSLSRFFFVSLVWHMPSESKGEDSNITIANVFSSDESIRICA